MSLAGGKSKNISPSPLRVEIFLVHINSVYHHNRQVTGPGWCESRVGYPKCRLGAPCVVLRRWQPDRSVDQPISLFIYETQCLHALYSSAWVVWRRVSPCKISVWLHETRVSRIPPPSSNLELSYLQVLLCNSMRWIRPTLIPVTRMYRWKPCRNRGIECTLSADFGGIPPPLSQQCWHGDPSPCDTFAWGVQITWLGWELIEIVRVVVWLTVTNSVLDIRVSYPYNTQNDPSRHLIISHLLRHSTAKHNIHPAFKSRFLN